MIINVRLQNFRCHQIINFTVHKGINLIYGPNGSGKTALLESISMLSVGKGLKNIGSSQAIKYDEQFLSINLSIDENNIQIEKGNNDKNITIKWNGVKISKIDVANHFGIIWLTPQIIFNFWRESQIRRHLIDRMTYSMVSSHANACLYYEKAKHIRSEIIHNNINDNALYKTYEKSIIRYGIEIFNNRLIFMNELNLILPKLNFAKKYQLELKDKAISEEEWMRNLETSRHMPCLEYGPHKTEVIVLCDNQNGAQSSTGEQCIAIICLIIAIFSMINQEVKILLLDDVLANLDESNRIILLNLLNQYAKNSYILISHTDYIYIDKCNYIKL